MSPLRHFLANETARGVYRYNTKGSSSLSTGSRFQGAGISLQLSHVADDAAYVKTESRVLGGQAPACSNSVKGENRRRLEKTRGEHAQEGDYAAMDEKWGSGCGRGRGVESITCFRG